MKKFSIALLAATSLSLAACGGETAEVADDGDAEAADTAEAAGTEGGDAETGGTPDGASASTEIDYGNDSGPYANDGECDDPRFQGDAMAMGLNTDNIGRDASDCRADVDAGRIALNPLFTQQDNYGDDSGEYANDGECDDIRFTGAYADQMVYLPEDIGHDASDCRAAVESGEATWQGATATPEYGVTLEEMGQ